MDVLGLDLIVYGVAREVLDWRADLAAGQVVEAGQDLQDVEEIVRVDDALLQVQERAATVAVIERERRRASLVEGKSFGPEHNSNDRVRRRHHGDRDRLAERTGGNGEHVLASPDGATGDPDPGLRPHLWLRCAADVS